VHSLVYSAAVQHRSKLDAIRFHTQRSRLHYHVQPPQSTAVVLRYSKPDAIPSYSLRLHCHVQRLPSKHG
jgi:hypothetical protein